MSSPHRALALMLVLGAVLVGCSGSPPRAGAPGKNECDGRAMAKLYLGRTRGASDTEISLSEIETFVASEVTPRFGGATLVETRGTWTPAGSKEAIWEASVIVEVVHAGDAESRKTLEAIARNYAERFAQESVLLFEAPGCGRFVSVQLEAN